MIEQTLVVFKPDAVVRALTGEILARFEKAGLKIVAAKFIHVAKELAEKHYPSDREEFITGMGKKSIENYKNLGIDLKSALGTDDPHEIGLIIRGWLVEYIISDPVCAVILEAPHAIEVVRKICGHTLPLSAAPGTIRGDFSYDSSYMANTGKRGVKNLLHASGSKKEALYEIPLWFTPQEIFSYKRADEDVMR